MKISSKNYHLKSSQNIIVISTGDSFLNVQYLQFKISSKQMNKTRTPVKSQKTKRAPECEDVDQEFCKRALSLLTSFYETPTADEILTFPPAMKVDVPPPDKKHNFNSNIVDLRLRRAQDQQPNAMDELNKLLEQRVEEMSKDLKESNANLDDVFMADKVNRPEVPRYLANIQKDLKREARAGRNKYREPPMDMKKIQTEYKERLEQSKLRGTERLRNRINKITNSGQPISQNTYHSNHVDDLDPRKRELERRKTLKERKDKQLHFMSPEQYKKLVRPKKPTEPADEAENAEYEE